MFGWAHAWSSRVTPKGAQFAVQHQKAPLEKGTPYPMPPGRNSETCLQTLLSSQLSHPVSP